MTNAKKFLALLLSVTLLVSALIVPGMTVSAAVDVSTISVWDGTTADTYADGDGSEGNPYKISNGAQLAKMVQEGNCNYYILTNDIYLNNVYDANGEFNPNWTASATNSWAFSDVDWRGSLDGNGCIIYGLYNNAASGATGLIASVGRNNAAVKTAVSNLGIRYASIKGSGQVGAIVAQADEYGDGCAFYNCFVDDTVTLSSSDQYAGGIAGYAARRDDANTGWYLENCYSLANVSAPSYRNAGKLATGYDARMAFVNCYTNGSVMPTAKPNYAPYSGCGGYTNCYGTVAAADNANGTWEVLTIDQMTGTGALDIMSALPKDTWTAVDGMTPVLTIFLDKLVVREEPSVDENGIWTGKIAKNFAEGTGVANDPYIIHDGAELALMVQTGAGKYYKLANDIYLNDVSVADWTASAKNVWNFPDIDWTGSLDGNNCIIYGLYNHAASSATGLIASVGRNNGAVKTTVSNLGIRYASIKGSGQVGAIVATADEYGDGCAFYNCFVDDTVTLSSSDQYAGGIAGYAARRDDANTGWKLENCYSLANVSAPSYRNAGKLATGYNANMTFKNCYTNGSILPTAKNEYASVASEKYVNCYGTVAAADNAGGTWAVLTIDQMTGAAALNTMSLDFESTWLAAKGTTPVLRSFASKLGVEEDIPVVLEDENGIWTGVTAESFIDNSAGTADDPIEIQNAGELALAITAGSGKCYVLTKDIYLNAEDSTANVWNNGGGEWTGTIDGNNHIIYGLYIPSGTASGLIAQPSRTGVTIKNLGIRKSNITGNNAGAFAGQVDAYRAVITFTNCFVDETVTVTSTGDYSGGFLGAVKRQDGASYGAHFTNCYSKAVVSGGTRANSKITAGYNGHFTFTNCYSDGSIVSANDSKYGSLLSEGVYNNCYSVNANGGGDNHVWNQITLDQMTGYNAVESMAFDFETTWFAAEGTTPVLRAFADKLGVTEAKPVIVEDENGVWTGVVPGAFKDKSEGTEADPILIQNAGEFVLALQNGKGLNYQLTKDIYLNNVSAENWTDSARAWDNGGRSFEGTIDGAGHILYGLYINNTSDKGGALFAAGTATGTHFKNFGVRKSVVNGGKYTALFIAVMDIYNNNASFEQVFIDETVTITGTEYVSGFVGRMDKQDANAMLSINNCYNTASMSGGSKALSGFAIGYNGKYQISNSYAFGYISYTGGNDAWVSKISPAYVNCYAGHAPSAKDTNAGNTWTALDDWEMKGIESIEKMADLIGDGSVWTAAKDSTPVLVQFADSLGAVTETYTVTYKNWDGTVLKEETAFVGDAVEAPEAPTKASDAQYSYAFNGWAQEGNTFTATFTETVNQYTVQFLGADGAVISTQTLDYGAMPVIPEAPQKAADAQYTYTFAGWDNEVVSVTENATYAPTYTSTVNKYTVTFKNEDGTVLSTEEVAYGTVPTAPTATKEATAEFTYTFAGWDNEVVAVTGDAEYTATYDATVNKYTVTFKNEDGTVLSTEEVAYGTVPAAPTATKEATAEFTYTFAGWDNEVVAVTGDAEYTATFTATVNKYTVTFLNDDGSVIETQEVAYGTVPTAPAAEKASDGKFEYTFAGWDKEIVAVTGDAEYTATYDATALYTMADVDALRVAILNGTEGVDVNGDGDVNVLDLVAMYNMVA